MSRLQMLMALWGVMAAIGGICVTAAGACLSHIAVHMWSQDNSPGVAAFIGLLAFICLAVGVVCLVTLVRATSWL